MRNLGFIPGTCLAKRHRMPVIFPTVNRLTHLSSLGHKPSPHDLHLMFRVEKLKKHLQDKGLK